MTHLVEGYLNTVDDAADPQTNERALAGLSLLFEALPGLSGTLKTRQEEETWPLPVYSGEWSSSTNRQAVPT